MIITIEQLKNIIREEVMKETMKEAMKKAMSTKGTINDFMDIMVAGQGNQKKTKEALIAAGYEKPFPLIKVSNLLCAAFKVEKESEGKDNESLLNQRNELLQNVVNLYIKYSAKFTTPTMNPQPSRNVLSNKFISNSNIMASMDRTWRLFTATEAKVFGRQWCFITARMKPERC